MSLLELKTAYTTSSVLVLRVVYKIKFQACRRLVQRTFESLFSRYLLHPVAFSDVVKFPLTTIAACFIHWLSCSLSSSLLWHEEKIVTVCTL